MQVRGESFAAENARVGTEVLVGLRSGGQCGAGWPVSASRVMVGIRRHLGSGLVGRVRRARSPAQLTMITWGAPVR